MLSEIRRVLKKGGFLIISTPNIQFIYHIIKLILGSGPKTSFGSNKKYYGSELYDGGHVHYFTVKDMRELLTKYNFQILTNRGTYNITKPILKNVLKYVSSSFLLKWLSPGFVIKAKAI